jgi:hypothetical protein
VTPLEIQTRSYVDGETFGDYSMINHTPRAGTCIAETLSFCCAIEKDIYMKVIKKL